MLMMAPAPSATPSAQRKSPQRCAERDLVGIPESARLGGGVALRRMISAFTGPGGHATDQPRSRPLMIVAVENGMSKLATLAEAFAVCSAR